MEYGGGCNPKQSRCLYDVDWAIEKGHIVITDQGMQYREVISSIQLRHIVSTVEDVWHEDEYAVHKRFTLSTNQLHHR